MSIGNTGCGKSTMLSSLIYGPESLVENIKMDGKIRKKVIEHKEEMNNLQIGHSNAESCTFFPDFI